MKHRKLRIAWSVTWGVLAVLLLVLWVRSYWWNDFISRPLGSQLILMQIRLGDFGVYIHPAAPLTPNRVQFNIGKQQIESGHTKQYLMNDGVSIYPIDGVLGFYFEKSLRTIVLGIPFWSLTLFSIVAASIPWLSYRFSLRTLLIATTVFAALLGVLAITF